MRPTKELVRLRDDALIRMQRLRRSAIDAVSTLSIPQSRVAIGHVTIELHNVWSNFARSYYLSCSLRPRRVSGAVVVPGTFTGTGFNDALGVAIRVYRPAALPSVTGAWDRRHEPTWHDPTVLHASCAALGCSNVGEIQMAISLATRVLHDLPCYRNFYGHRNGMTAQAARNLAPLHGVPSLRHPTQILSTTPTGRNFPLIVEWLDEVGVIVELLCD